MSTARDLIKASLRLIGVIGSGETPTSAEESDALSSLNRMIDSWSTEKLMIYQVVREEFAFTYGVGTYTLGSTGDFVTSRPIKIENAGLEVQGSNPSNYEFPLEILNKDQWSLVRLKDLQSIYPLKIYIDMGYPLVTLNVWPIPQSTDHLVLYSWKPLTTFSNATDTVTLPQGYEDAIVNNLAIKLAPEYNRIPSDIVIADARTSKATVKRINTKPVYLKCDPGVLARGSIFNIYTGEAK